MNMNEGRITTDELQRSPLQVAQSLKTVHVSGGRHPRITTSTSPTLTSIFVHVAIGSLQSTFADDNSLIRIGSAQALLTTLICGGMLGMVGISNGVPAHE